jgi:hypothetical protein
VIVGPIDFAVQRRVRERLHPPPFAAGAPPFGLLLRRLCAGAQAQSEKTPRFRGVLAVEPWPTRTGDCGFEVWTMPQCAFVSVARPGGSDSLLIRTQLRPRAFSSHSVAITTPRNPPLCIHRSARSENPLLQESGSSRCRQTRRHSKRS